MNTTTPNFDDPLMFQEFLRRHIPGANEVINGAMHQIFYANARQYQFEENFLRNSGLTSPQFNLLVCLLRGELLWGLQGLRPSEISLMHGTSRNNVSVVLARLEEKKLISRTVHESDRRGFLIQLTPEGRLLVEKLVKPYFMLYNLAAEDFSAEEQTMFLSLLGRYYKNLVKMCEQSQAEPAEDNN